MHLTLDEIGKPIAYGRTAEIYAWPGDQILKLFYASWGTEAVAHEARMARAVAESGLPVPAVGEEIQIGERSGLIYARVQGPSLWEFLARRPWAVARSARRMAALHSAIHAVMPAAQIPRQRGRLTHKIEADTALPGSLRARLLSTLAALPDGNTLCHGDFHPANILMTNAGAVIIDWTDATVGNALADVARTTVLALGAAATSQIPNQSQKLFVRLFHALYIRHYFRAHPGSQADYRRWLPVVAAARLSEGIPEVEAWLLEWAAQ